MPTKTFENLDLKKKQRITEAAVNEFSKNAFENANVSNIIKDAKIPRGSFYQYFENKLDLYKMIFDDIGKKKMEYLSELLQNREQMPFLDLFRLLYIGGTKFAFENPKYVEISSLLFSSKGQIFDLLIRDNLDIAKQYYISYIDTDKKLGRIDPNVDSGILADLVIDMTMNISVDQMVVNGKDFDANLMLDKIDKVIYIFKKGIYTGE